MELSKITNNFLKNQKCMHGCMDYSVGTPAFFEPHLPNNYNLLLEKQNIILMTPLNT